MKVINSDLIQNRVNQTGDPSINPLPVDRVFEAPTLQMMLEWMA